MAVTRTTLTGIGALDATVWAIVPRPMPWHGVLPAEPLEVGSKASARSSRIRSQGAWDGFQPGRVVHFLCRKLVHFQMSLDITSNILVNCDLGSAHGARTCFTPSLGQFVRGRPA